MLVSSNSKLFRKFLILAVMIAGLCFALAPGKTVSARLPGMCEPPYYGPPCCCSVCLDRATECMWNNCTGLQGAQLLACNAACNDEQIDCRTYCDGLC
jgi:hypothetical protein